MSVIVERKRWLPLANFPATDPTSIAMMNRATVLVACHSGEGGDYGDTSKGIYKYDVHKDAWTKFVEYLKNRRLLYPCMAINSQTNRLYVHSYSDPDYYPHWSNPYPMNVIDTLNAKFEINKAHDQNKTVRGMLKPIVLNVDGTIHLIGNGHHFTFDDVKNSFVKIYDFDSTRFYESSFYGSSAIYVPTKQQIFLFSSNGIAVFSVTLGKWKWLQKIQFNFGCCSTVLTSNERYIIVTGRVGKIPAQLYSQKTSIQVFNTRDFKLHPSSVNCPMPTDPDRTILTFRTGNVFKDGMLVIGWIKSVFKSEKYRHLSLPPTAVIELMVSWYSQEQLHWIHSSDYSSDYKHFAINIRHIL
eukprot:265140_1